MSIKRSIELFVMTHNNREVSYIVPEELLSHIAIFISCLIIFFDFTTPLLIWCTFCHVPSHTSPSSFSILILSFSLYYTCQSPSLSLYFSTRNLPLQILYTRAGSMYFRAKGNKFKLGLFYI